MAAEAIYLVKWIEFNHTPRAVLQQNENGPCPLLALANALLLQGRLALPPGASEVVGHDFIVSRIGEFLVEAAAANPRLDNEAALGAAMSVLPQLSAGLDVNVKFDSVEAFEFTHHLSIFDLAGVRLLHGWVVDPQEKVAPLLLGQSYNQIADKLISALQKPVSVRRVPASSPSASPTNLHVAMATPVARNAGLVRVVGDVSEFELKGAAAVAAEGMALFSCPIAPSPASPAGAAPVAAMAAGSVAAQPKLSSLDEGELAADSAAAVPGYVDDAAVAVTTGAESAVMPCVEPAVEADASSDPPSSIAAPAPAATSAAVAPSPSPDHAANPSDNSTTPLSPAAAPLPATAGEECAPTHPTAGAGGSPPLLSPPTPAVLATHSLGGFSRQEALLVDEWLADTASQLTYCGLLGLHERMRDGETTVIFRNNHYATVHKRAPALLMSGLAGAQSHAELLQLHRQQQAPSELFSLVTDVGYSRVPGVVWEKMDDIAESTLCGADFLPCASDLQQLTDGALPSLGGSERGAPAGDSTASYSADALLAASLQREEEDQVRGQAPLAPGVGGGGGATMAQPRPRLLVAPGVESASAPAAQSGAGAHSSSSAHAYEGFRRDGAAAGAGGTASAPLPPWPDSAPTPTAKRNNDRYAAQAATLREARLAREQREAEMPRQEGGATPPAAAAGGGGGGKKDKNGCAIC